MCLFDILRAIERALVTPISKNQILTWPLSKADEVQKYFSKVIGIDNFFEYLDSTEEGKKLSS